MTLPHSARLHLYVHGQAADHNGGRWWRNSSAAAQRIKLSGRLQLASQHFQSTGSSRWSHCQCFSGDYVCTLSAPQRCSTAQIAAAERAARWQPRDSTPQVAYRSLCMGVTSVLRQTHRRAFRCSAASCCQRDVQRVLDVSRGICQRVLETHMKPL